MVLIAEANCLSFMQACAQIHIALWLLVPPLGSLFSVVSLDGMGMAQIAGLAVLPTVCIQIYKWVHDIMDDRKMARDKAKGKPGRK